MGPVCVFVCLQRAGGVRTLLQPARAQCLRLSERFFHSYFWDVFTVLRGWVADTSWVCDWWSLIAAGAAAAMANCVGHTFHCDNKYECADITALCDRFYDCSDGSDEQHCRTSDWLQLPTHAPFNFFQTSARKAFDLVSSYHTFQTINQTQHTQFLASYLSTLTLLCLSCNTLNLLQF